MLAQRAGPRLAVDELRAFLDGLPQPLPDGTTMASAVAGGVPGEWLTRDDGVAGRVVLFLHGGAYTIGSPRSHRALAARMGVAAKADVFVADYRLAPEHPFPAAVDDARAVYRGLLDDRGVAPGSLVVGGDSAGGGLTAALLLSLKADAEPLPAGGLLLAPWLDLAMTGESLETRREADFILDREGLSEDARAYAGDHPLDHPLVSPLYGDLAGLPPLFVQVGDDDVLVDDAIRFADAANLAEVEVSLDVWGGMPHVFQAFAGVVPEAEQALHDIATWIDHLLSLES